MTDEQQLETAIKLKAAIFTHDADFIRISINKNHSGIIYAHKQKMSTGEAIKRLKIIAETTSTEEMQNKTIFL
jgi:hypothetical protein